MAFSFAGVTRRPRCRFARARAISSSISRSLISNFTLSFVAPFTQNTTARSLALWPARTRTARADIKNPPRQTPIRILVCVWWLSTIVLVNMYLGTLFGQLVVPRQPRSIETLEELVQQEQVNWCVTRGSALDELFRHSANGTVYGLLGQRMRNVSSAAEGVARVVHSGWAFIRERSMLTFMVAKEHERLRACRLELAKRADFFSVGFGLALTKGSPYLGPINAALTLMIENGFMARWQSKYSPARNRYTECQLQPLREGEPLSMKHFISVYLVSSLAAASSFALLVYQNMHEQVLAKLRAGRRARPGAGANLSPSQIGTRASEPK